ncbi:hypothetical protein ART_0836 [Arthrobacter sp. PAMC 25486]|uniref:hypothetical protein n=1 Tax=Arthrobacter sp. PAMC 25486 TaxID=1494608 RepID=UPI000535D7F8|nr:hypothetical protein [Arthrobacter sp. PAMC 25486]AIY00435.1 hypothetical protein ART_0836 [Arthrobacter sp. PAMC 25486]
MNQHPVEEIPEPENRAAGKHSAVEDFIKLIVPEPELLEEEANGDPDIEPRKTGA